MFKPRRTLWVVLGTFAVAATAAAAVSLAGDDSSPTTRPVAGTFALVAVHVDQNTCVGTDGAYLEVTRAVFEGKSSSPDPRFNGRIQVVSGGALLNTTTGLGTDHGRITWWDAAGKRTAVGTYRDVITQGSVLTGIEVAQVAAADGLPAGTLVANFKGKFDAQLSAAGEFGGAGDGQTPAVIQSGQCGSPEQDGD
jgi:hypothetical protein